MVARRGSMMVDACGKQCFTAGVDITVGQAKAALGIKTDAELARLLGVSKQAISNLGGDDSALPDGRQWQLRAMRPDLFPAPEAKAVNRAA